MNLATASILYQKTNFECTIFFLSTSQRWRALRRLFPVPALCLVLICSFKTGLKDPIYFICEHVCWRWKHPIFFPLSCFPSHVIINVSKERDGEETGTEQVLVDGKGQNNHNSEMFLLILSVNTTTSAAFHKCWAFPLRRIKTTWMLFIYCILLVFCITYLLYHTSVKVPALLVWILLPRHWLLRNLGLIASNQQRVENESISSPVFLTWEPVCMLIHSVVSVSDSLRPCGT